jgi:hypothetical protein
MLIMSAESRKRRLKLSRHPANAGLEEFTMDEAAIRPHPEPWNKGKLVGQKAPFKLKEIWAIRVRLQLFRRVRDLALFDLGIDSKLRACDLVRLKVRDICHGDRVAVRAIVMQQKTSRPVQFIAATRSGQIPHSSAPRPATTATGLRKFSIGSPANSDRRGITTTQSSKRSPRAS